MARLTRDASFARSRKKMPAEKNPDLYVMPLEEIRVRLDAARRIVPISEISRRMKMRSNDLYCVLYGKPMRLGQLGTMRRKKLAKLCIDIQTGAIKHNGKKTSASVTYDSVADRAVMPVHRVIFQKGAIGIQQNKAPENQKMPSFAKLFGGKPALILPKLSNRS